MYPQDERLYRHLLAFVGQDAANALENCNAFRKELQDDIEATSGLNETGYYNDDDLRLSLGRIIMDAFGVEI